jgi:ryanodine receptor 2
MGTEPHQTGMDIRRNTQRCIKAAPCLVPYDELPESEKAYDRDTSVETLKLITKLGFRIIRK